jgi:hypothetical protein
MKLSVKQKMDFIWNLLSPFLSNKPDAGTVALQTQLSRIIILRVSSTAVLAQNQ